jgi:hypothetical protein
MATLNTIKYNTMRLHFVFYLLLIITFTACKKEDDSSHTYSSRVILNNLPPIMGGCLDSDGSLITFSLPLLSYAQLHSNVVLSAKIQKINQSGSKNTIFDFGEKTFSSSSWIYNTFAGYSAWIPDDARVNLVSKSDGGIYFSYNHENKISLIHNNSFTDLNSIERVVSMTSNRKDGIFAITAPCYMGDFPYTLKSPPVIYEIDSQNNKSIYFTFPENFVFYINCGYSGFTSALYPIDILIDMVVDSNNNLIVSFGYDNIIYKIDQSKELTTIVDNIHCPASIEVDNSDKLFVVSAPEFVQDYQGRFNLTKPVEVWTFKNSEPTCIFRGEKNISEGCFTDSKIKGVYNINRANYNISINALNEIFLEDPLLGQVVLIK